MHTHTPTNSNALRCTAWTILNECMAQDALGDNEFPGSLLYSVRAGPTATAPKSVPYECRPLAVEANTEEELSQNGNESKALVPFVCGVVCWCLVWGTDAL
jgi:hypothetical protein